MNEIKTNGRHNIAWDKIPCNQCKELRARAEKAEARVKELEAAITHLDRLTTKEEVWCFVISQEFDALRGGEGVSDENHE